MNRCDVGGADRPLGLILDSSFFFSGIKAAYTHTDADTLCVRRGAGGH